MVKNMIRIVSTDKAPKPIAPYSQAVRVGPYLYISGQVAINPETGLVEDKDIKGQTKRVIENILAILRAEGGDLNNIIKVTVYLADKNYYKDFNEVYGEYFKNWRPSRTTVEAKPPRDDLLIEMDAIAYLG